MLRKLESMTSERAWVHAFISSEFPDEHLRRASAEPRWRRPRRQSIGCNSSFYSFIYWLLFGSTVVLWCLFNAICLALFDSLIVMSETIMLYVVLVSFSMCRYPSTMAEGLWLAEVGARGYHYYNKNDSIGFQVGQYTMSLVHSVIRK